MQVSVRELKANPSRAINLMQPGEPIQMTAHRKVGAELDATDGLIPAIEVIDARIEQLDRHTKVLPRTVDLTWCGAVLASSFTRPVLAKAGDLFDVGYGRLGRLEFQFI